MFQPPSDDGWPFFRRWRLAAGGLAVGLIVACLVTAAGQAAAAAAAVDEAIVLEAAAVGIGQTIREELPAPNDRLAEQQAEQAELAELAEEEKRVSELIDQAVTARLAGIPRPRYIPATDLAPPRGLLLYKEDGSRGDFPFAMALGGYLQLRWLEFARSATTSINSAGETRPINNINAFNLNRFMITMSGHVVDERLIYNFSFFGTSNGGARAGVVPIGMAGWKFSDAATIGAGVTQVPGSREWLDKSPWNLGVDRSMANTFFRPGFSPGAMAIGSLLNKTVHYEAGVWNAIDGGTLGVLRRGTSMAWAGNTWWEPMAPFGLGYGDMEHHEDAAIRLGCSGVYAPTYAIGVLGLNPEDTIVRLSDGTPLALPNALGPNSRVNQFLYQLATVDAGWKYRGLAANFEYYFRTLDGFKGTGAFERSSIFDHGGLGYLSWCIVPQTYEIYARSSVVTGPYGTGQEYGGGFNYYINRSRQGRFTLEALHMNRNPAQNILYPYRAGSSGTAIQTQFVVAF